MNINCVPLQSRRDEFKNYLETSGVNDLLTEALLKLYKEDPRPEDSMEFLRNQMFKNFPKLDEVNAMKEQIKKLKREIENYEKAKIIAQVELKKTDSQMETLLYKLFLPFDADETGNSLLKKHLELEMVDELKDWKTEYRGSLLDNIISGLKHFDSDIGIFASDPNAYENFDELFNPVLEELFDLTSETDENGNEVKVSQIPLDWGDIETFKILDPQNLFIKSISITIRRGVDKYPFAPIITAQKLMEIAKIVQQVLTEIDDEDLKGKYYELEDIEEEQKKKWIEEGILFPEPQDKFLEAAGTYRFWPNGRGLFVNDKKTLKAWVNAEEHLQITSFENNGNLREVYQRLVKVMEKFSEVKFARDKRWGFLTHNLKNIGNTMQIQVKAKFSQMLKEENKEKLEILCEGNHLKYEDVGNGKMLLTNIRKIGMSEIQAVKAFEKGISEIIIAEKCAYIP